MAEDFQGGSWWIPSEGHRFSSPRTEAAAPLDDGVMGSFGWSTAETLDINARSSDESASSIVSETSSIHHFPYIQKPPPQPPCSTAAGESAGVLSDSALQMMGFNLASSSTAADWDLTLLHGSGREEVNVLHEETAAVSKLSDYPHQVQKAWCGAAPKCFTAGEEDSALTDALRPINLNHSSFFHGAPSSSPADCKTNFPVMATAAPGTPLLESMVGIEALPQQPPLYYPSTAATAAASFLTDTHETLPSSWPLLPHPALQPSFLRSEPTNHFHLNNSSTFWDPLSSAGAGGFSDIGAAGFPAPPPQPHLRFLSQAFQQKPSFGSLPSAKVTHEIKKSVGETLLKRPRMEAPSPLPTFKVRKEKLGDRITALQQLVSPFGKTDTASVLQEAIEYIKYLHDQVSVLSNTYMKNGDPPAQPPEKTLKLKEAEMGAQDLRSRGLCLVPISSTFPVANESIPEFWAPTYGGTFR